DRGNDDTGEPLGDPTPVRQQRQQDPAHHRQRIRDRKNLVRSHYATLKDRVACARPTTTVVAPVAVASAQIPSCRIVVASGAVSGMPRSASITRITYSAR